jgi:hypothetical protein
VALLVPVALVQLLAMLPAQLPLKRTKKKTKPGRAGGTRMELRQMMLMTKQNQLRYVY